MTNLGFGVGYRPVHFDDLLHAPPGQVDWIEIISENFINVGGPPRAKLDQVRERYPVVMHGVSLSIAGTDAFPPSYLAGLRRLVEELRPALVSDHLCWSNGHGRHLYDLLPFPYTRKNLEWVSQRVDEVQQALGRRILLENPTAYVAFNHDEMPEADFLAELADKSGCGILLDINNLYVNQCNLGYDPHLYFEVLDPEVVQQFHLAGHTVEENIRIDTHDQPVCHEVWELYRLAAARYPDTPTMIEWDDAIPAFQDLIKELDKARQAKPQTAPATSKGTRTTQPGMAEPWPLRDFQKTFAKHMTEGSSEATSQLLAGTKFLPAPREVGLAVYHQAYFLRLRDALKDAFRTLHYILEDAAFDRTIASYLAKTPLRQFSLDMAGVELANFLREHGVDFEAGVDSNLLADLAAFDAAMQQAYLAPDTPALAPAHFAGLSADEWETLRLTFHPSVKLLHLQSDPRPIYAAAAHGSPQAPDPVIKSLHLAIYRQDERSISEEIPPDEWLHLAAFRRGDSLHDICADREEEVTSVLSHVAKWAHAGWLVLPTTD